MRLLAVDPGDVHNGTAYVETFHGEPKIWIHWTRDLAEGSLFELVETAPLDQLVVEEFRLYPEFAREQGYSDFPTCEVIGVLKYIARKRGISLAMQGAGMKKRARRIGERIAPDIGKERMVGAGRSRYWGWDFGARTQHERDAQAHAVWWILRNDASPMFERDYAKNGGVSICV